MDTVKLNGDGFTPNVSEGTKVKKGDLLLTFDMEKLKSAGYSFLSPVIITNSDAYADILPTDAKSVEKGNGLITLIR
jgi:beta-glucoside PTS system EIICBA component